MEFPSKLKAIRKAEKLTQREFCDILAFSPSTFRKYEAGIFEPGAQALLRITNHSRFKKYTLWLMTGDIAPDGGQISPT